MKNLPKQFVVCVKNKGHEVSLERRKIYQVVPDAQAAKHRQVRVIDESGGDYLYPQDFFASLELPQPVRRDASLWEDLYDGYLAHARRGERRESLATVKRLVGARRRAQRQ